MHKFKIGDEVYITKAAFDESGCWGFTPECYSTIVKIDDRNPTMAQCIGGSITGNGGSWVYLDYLVPKELLESPLWKALS